MSKIQLILNEIFKSFHSSLKIRKTQTSHPVRICFYRKPSTLMWRQMKNRWSIWRSVTMVFHIFKENRFGKVTDVSEFIRFRVFPLSFSPHNAPTQAQWLPYKNGFYAVSERDKKTCAVRGGVKVDTIVEKYLGCFSENSWLDINLMYFQS